MKNNPIKILKIDSSARTKNSYSRLLTNEIVNKLLQIYPHATVIHKDLSADLPFLSETMVEGMFISAEQRTEEQKNALRISDEMVKQLKECNIRVIGAPIYNFSVPASLKAYIDLVTRAGLTFKFNNGIAEGLVKDVKAFVVITSSGTALNSDFDFVSGYLKVILGFIGITDVEIIDATQLKLIGEEKILQQAINTIENLVEEEIAAA